MLAIFGISGCTLLSPTSSTTDYNEDLSTHRPRVEAADTVNEMPEEKLIAEVSPENDQTANVDSKLKAITNNNRTSNTASGFTIQVYSGTSREQASEAKTKVYKINPDSRPVTKYEQPIYKVLLGEFGDRLAAQTTYAEVVKEFPDAIVIPSRIRL
jgi:septal ring-binding cell division protein DamX